MLEYLTHILFFFVTIACLVSAWLVFSVINNYVSRAECRILQTIAGTLNCIVLFAAIAITLNYFVLDFSVGLLTLLGLWLLNLVRNKLANIFLTPKANA